MPVGLSSALDPKSVKHGTTKSSKKSNEVTDRVHNSEIAHIFLGYMSLGYFCFKANIIFLFSLKKHRQIFGEDSESVLVLLLYRLQEQTHLCISIKMKAGF